MSGSLEVQKILILPSKTIILDLYLEDLKSHLQILYNFPSSIILTYPFEN